MPNYARYADAFRHAAEAAGMKVSALGSVFGREILFASTGVSLRRTGVLVLSGFHGEEFAPPLGILRCLQSESARSRIEQLSLGIVPVVNPEGFDRGTRYNHLKQKSNQATSSEKEGPSEEGKILHANFELLSAYANFYLDMHEDIGARGFYLYRYGASAWHQDLLTIGESYFGLQPDGRITDIPDPRHELRDEDDTNVIQDGLVDPQPDGSFDDLFSKRALFAAITETPASASEDLRVRCNSDLLQWTLNNAAQARHIQLVR